MGECAGEVIKFANWAFQCPCVSQHVKHFYPTNLGVSTALNKINRHG